MTRSTLCLTAIALAAATQAASAGETRGKFRDTEPSNNSINTAPTINLSQIGRCFSFRATLTNSDIDIFRFDAGPESQVVFITTPISGTGGSPLATPDTVVSLLNSAGTPIATNDDAGRSFPGTNFGSVVRYDIQSAGTYYFRVTPLSNSSLGEYIVTVAGTFGLNADFGESFPDNNDTPATADILDLGIGGTLSGSCELNSSSDADYFAVDMSRGDILVASTTPQISAFVTPDTIIDVLDTDGATVLLTDDDDGAGTFPFVINVRSSTIRFKAPAPGRYYIRVRGFQGATGPYRPIFARFSSTAPFCSGDADGNGTVNFTDITNVLANFGTVCP
jgi:hypothetical protein